MVISFVQPTDSYLGLFILLISISYNILLIQIQPHRDRYMNKIEIFSSQLITLIFLLAIISNSLSGEYQMLFLLILYALIVLQISTLIWSVISRSIIANQDSIVQMPLFKSLSNLAKKQIKINSFFYKLLKNYSPTLFKMIMRNSDSNSFNKFIKWRNLLKKLKSLPIENLIKYKEGLLLESKNLISLVQNNNSKKLTPLNMQESIEYLLFSYILILFLNKRNKDGITQRKNPEKQSAEMIESDKQIKNINIQQLQILSDRLILSNYDEDSDSVKDEINSNQNTIRYSKLGPNSKLTFEQQQIQNSQSRFNLLSSFSPAQGPQGRENLASHSDTCFLSGQDLKIQSDGQLQKSQ